MTEKKIVIFANGKLKNRERARHIASDADFIICADGGSVYCDNLGIIPDLLVGDLDSTPKKLRKKFEMQHVEIDQHPTHKDSTDLELALRHAVKMREEHKSNRHDKVSVHLIAALGGRLDMTLATILIPAAWAYRNLDIFIHGDHNLVRLLSPGSHTVYGTPGARVSFLPIAGEVKDLSLIGFEYSVDHINLRLGSSRCVSNHIEKDSCLVCFTEGMLLMVMDN
ncbi:MAG: thiamine diphosphokinase [Desulforhopalus sp.]|nr:thiamine diphosphokinase [Desulforhopalus sp.]